jgi:hypothetical protein
LVPTLPHQRRISNPSVGPQDTIDPDLAGIRSSLAALGIVGPEGADLLYFAFVNCTTLGYGDVTPVKHWSMLGP